jgi:hypothetical protein
MPRVSGGRILIDNPDRDAEPCLEELLVTFWREKPRIYNEIESSHTHEKSLKLKKPFDRRYTTMSIWVGIWKCRMSAGASRSPSIIL